ncbi:hypothetical protein U1Q18_038060, partial [Sarracenia purpurea var. burkii]
AMLGICDHDLYSAKDMEITPDNTHDIYVPRDAHLVPIALMSQVGFSFLLVMGFWL